MRNDFLIYFLRHAILQCPKLKIARPLGILNSLCLSSHPHTLSTDPNLRRNATLCHLRIIFIHKVIAHSSSESVPRALKSTLPLPHSNLHFTPSHPALRLTPTSTSATGFLTAVPSFWNALSGTVSIPWTSKPMTIPATKARISIIAKCRPGHRCLPPPKGK
jgi:hypothetical protein